MTRDVPDDPDYSPEFRFDIPGPPTIARLWVDHGGTCWLESNSGERVAVPDYLRRNISNLLNTAARMK